MFIYISLYGPKGTPGIIAVYTILFEVKKNFNTGYSCGDEEAKHGSFTKIPLV